MSTATLDLATRLGALLEARGWRVSTAESCTGGLLAGAITDVAGSSGWFERGFVTYSNEAKTEMLGVRTETLAAHGAVSEPTAREMAAGALERSAVGPRYRRDRRRRAFRRICRESPSGWSALHRGVAAGASNPGRSDSPEIARQFARPR